MLPYNSSYTIIPIKLSQVTAADVYVIFLTRQIGTRSRSFFEARFSGSGRDLARLSSVLSRRAHSAESGPRYRLANGHSWLQCIQLISAREIFERSGFLQCVSQVLMEGSQKT